MNKPQLADALRQSRVVHDRAAIRDAIQRVAAALREAYADEVEPPLFLTVMNGGMFFPAESIVKRLLDERESEEGAKW